MLTQPPWIELSVQERRSIRFIWDDTRAMLDFTGDPTRVLRASMKMSLRARMVLCAGLYEWIVWRFDGLHRRKEPLQIAEAAWCASIDPRYMSFFELTREDWLGPIEGPLWCAAMWLQPAMSTGHLFPRKVYDAVDFLTRVVLHVMPEPRRFEAWSASILDRLIETFPLEPEDDPFVDVFDRRVARRLGVLIGRNVLDPAVPYDPALGVAFLSSILSSAHRDGNPFLATAGDLRDAGFIDVPYQLPAEAG